MAICGQDKESRKLDFERVIDFSFGQVDLRKGGVDLAAKLPSGEAP